MIRSIFLLLFLAGCSGSVITDTVVQHDAPVAVPTAEPMTLNSVQWQVLAIPQLQALITKLKTAQQQNAVVFVLDTQNYTNLTLNFVEIERYIKEQKAILVMLQQILAQRAGQVPSSTSTPSK